MDGYPQYAPSAKQGNLGVSIVSRIVDEDFGWLFKRNHQEHDFGIDGQIEVITDGAVTGQMLGCQIKCGPSFFRESNPWGYVYHGETKHFNYLANYPLPVIIVICDPETKEGFWVRFLAGEAQITDVGWKITIPRENKLSSSKAGLQAFLPAVTDHLSPLREYWRVNNILFKFEFFLFMIERDEVQTLDILRAKEFRSRICSTKELALHCQGKIEFSFSGYDDDPNELFEIEEVRRYIEVLDPAFPELFFFVRTAEPAATLMLFFFSLFGVGWEGERSTPGNPRKFIVDFSLTGPFLRRHFDGLNLISEWLGLPDEEIMRISKAVMQPFGYPPEA